MEIKVDELKKEKYKSASKIASTKGMCKITKTITICVMIFFVFVILIGFLDKPINIASCVLSLGIIGVNFCIYSSAKSKYEFAESANLYVNNFREDVDGIIKAADLAYYVGQSEAYFLKNFSELLQKGYIINCKIERKNNINYIVLNNSILKQSMEKHEDIKEIVLNDIKDFNELKHYKCPNCGGTIEINDINNVVCNYCRTKLIFQQPKKTSVEPVNINVKENYNNYIKTAPGILSSSLLAGFFSIWIIVCLGVLAENIEEYSREPQMIFIFLVFIGIAAMLLYKNCKKVSNIQLIRIYEIYLRKQNTGIIEIRRMAAHFKTPEQQVIRNITRLIKAGYLINCRLETINNVNYLVLNKTVKQSLENDSKFKEIILKDIEEYNSIENYPCPSCGATINIKDKENVVCDYCRTRLHFKRIVDNKTKKA